MDEVTSYDIWLISGALRLTLVSKRSLINNFQCGGTEIQIGELGKITVQLSRGQC